MAEHREKGEKWRWNRIKHDRIEQEEQIYWLRNQKIRIRRKSTRVKHDSTVIELEMWKYSSLLSLPHLNSLIGYIHRVPF